MYFDLGSDTYVVTNTAIPSQGIIDADTTGQAVRVGVNYHFGH